MDTLEERKAEGRDVLEERGGGGALEPKNLCTKNGANEFFLL